MPNAPGWTTALTSTSKLWLHVTLISILVGSQSFLQRRHMLHLTKIRSICLWACWRLSLCALESRKEGEKLQSEQWWGWTGGRKALKNYRLSWEIHGMHSASAHSGLHGLWSIRLLLPALALPSGNDLLIESLGDSMRQRRTQLKLTSVLRSII
jgi:hypothetical protein